jgi:hypothetical protein
MAMDMLADPTGSWNVRSVALEAIMKMSLPDTVQHIDITRHELDLKWVICVDISGVKGSIEIVEEFMPDEYVFPIKEVLDKIRAFL